MDNLDYMMEADIAFYFYAPGCWYALNDLPIWDS